jgi:ABC-type transporter Mla subunit MlaD
MSTVNISDTPYSVSGQEISNPFFEIDPTSTFTFIWSDDLAGNNVALEEIYNALYAYSNVNDIGSFRDNVASALQELDRARKALTDLGQPESKIDNLSQLFTSLAGFEADVDDFIEDAQEFVSFLPSSYSASIRAILLQLSEAAAVLNLKIPTFPITDDQLNNFYAALDKMGEAYGVVQLQLKSYSNALENKSSTEYNDLAFALMGENGGETFASDWGRGRNFAVL